MAQRYWAFRGDGVVQRSVRVGEDGHVRQLGEERVDGIVEAEGAVLDEGHGAGGDDRLGHRAEAADGVGCHRCGRAGAVEGEGADGLDVDGTVAGDEGEGAGGEAGVDVVGEQVAYAGEPFRREPTGGHVPPPALDIRCTSCS